MALAWLLGAGPDGDRDLDDGRDDVPPRPAVIDLSGAAAPTSASDPSDRRTWITHQITPHERLSQIAARYAVKRDEVVEWNKLSSRRVALKPGKTLRIYARRAPPPRQKLSYTAQPGDTWSSIAVDHRVEHRDLLAMNRGKRSPQPGDQLTIWIDPGSPRTVNVAPGPPPPPAPEGIDGARSVGAPNRGRIKDAVQLPDSPLYTRGFDRWLWGSSHTIRALHAAIADFRHQSGFDGEIVIGSMSLRRGGRFAPHRSHQSGRDVDIRLPLLPALPLTAFPNADEIDWPAAWELVRALVRTGEIEVIFLEGPLQRRLYQAALWEGATPEQLREIIAWPNRKGHEGALVRHSRGHDGHIHVRFRCGPDEPRCRPRRRDPEATWLASAPHSPDPSR
jgi:LysM repeat protein